MYKTNEGFEFYDAPARELDKMITWDAELTLMGMNSSGDYVPMYTITYGFTIVDGIVEVKPIIPVTPSVFHLSYIN